MKRIIALLAIGSLVCGPAIAQNTRPQAQTNNMQKPSNIEKGIQTKTNTTTTGMNKNGMAKGGTVKPDASGQGGSGPGSDQGGTRSNNMK